MNLFPKEKEKYKTTVSATLVIAYACSDCGTTDIKYDAATKAIGIGSSIFFRIAKLKYWGALSRNYSCNFLLLPLHAR